MAGPYYNFQAPAEMPEGQFLPFDPQQAMGDMPEGQFVPFDPQQAMGDMPEGQFVPFNPQQAMGDINLGDMGDAQDQLLLIDDQANAFDEEQLPLEPFLGGVADPYSTAPLEPFQATASQEPPFVPFQADPFQGQPFEPLQANAFDMGEFEAQYGDLGDQFEGFQAPQAAYADPPCAQLGDYYPQPEGIVDPFLLGQDMGMGMPLFQAPVDQYPVVGLGGDALDNKLVVAPAVEADVYPLPTEVANSDPTVLPLPDEVTPTYTGTFVNNSNEAEQLIAQALEQGLPILTSRPDKKLENFWPRGGHVIVFQTGQMARWTDCVAWSDQRPSVKKEGEETYSMYREVIDKDKKSGLVARQTAPPVQEDAVLAGSLRGTTYPFRPDGLMKRVFTSKVHKGYVLVAYYRLLDARDWKSLGPIPEPDFSSPKAITRTAGKRKRGGATEASAEPVQPAQPAQPDLHAAIYQGEAPKTREERQALFVRLREQQGLKEFQNPKRKGMVGGHIAGIYRPLCVYDCGRKLDSVSSACCDAGHWQFAQIAM